MGLIKFAVGLAAVTGAMGAIVYGKNQHAIKDTKWYREAAMTVSAHEGVHAIIGPPPLEMGDVSRHLGNKYKPLLPVEPEPLYIIQAPLKGVNGSGNMRLYLNYLEPIEVVRKDMNAWNVGLIEIQVGDSEENRFVVKEIKS